MAEQYITWLCDCEETFDDALSELQYVIHFNKRSLTIVCIEEIGPNDDNTAEYSPRFEFRRLNGPERVPEVYTMPSKKKP